MMANKIGCVCQLSLFTETISVLQKVLSVTAGDF